MKKYDRSIDDKKYYNSLKGKRTMLRSRARLLVREWLLIKDDPVIEELKKKILNG